MESVPECLLKISLHVASNCPRISVFPNQRDIFFFFQCAGIPRMDEAACGVDGASYEHH